MQMAAVVTGLITTLINSTRPVQSSTSPITLVPFMAIIKTGFYLTMKAVSNTLTTLTSG